MSLKTLLFPPRCLLCREVQQAEHEDGLCGSCRALMQAECRRHLHRGMDSVWVVSAAGYGGAVRSALLRIKSGAVVAAAAPMGELLTAALREQLPEFRPDLVTFVPSSALRSRTRGFTLSEEMAKVVAQRLGVPCRPTLQHALLSAKQAGLRGEQRSGNAAKSFALRPGIRLVGQKVLLVDDVVASGATINTCAKLLRQTGAAEIVGLVFAQSEKRR